MSAIPRSRRSRDDGDVTQGTTAAAAASEESSSLSPASRVLAMADKVADEEEGSDIDSEDGSDDSIGPGPRSRRTASGSGGDMRARPLLERRGYVQERRGKHKQSALRRPTLLDNNSPDSPAGSSQASSNESWRNALFGDRKFSPRSGVLGEHDLASDPAANGEEVFLEGASEVAEMCRDEEKAVESMSVKDLKAKAAELGIDTGGRKSQLQGRIKQKLSASFCPLEDAPASTAAAAATAKAVQQSAPEGGVFEDGPGSGEGASVVASDVLLSPEWRCAAVSRDVRPVRDQEEKGRRESLPPIEPDSRGISPPVRQGDGERGARTGEGVVTAGEGPGEGLVASSTTPLPEGAGEMAPVAIVAVYAAAVGTSRLPVPPGEGSAAIALPPQPKDESGRMHAHARGVVGADAAGDAGSDVEASGAAMRDAAGGEDVGWQERDAQGVDAAGEGDEGFSPNEGHTAGCDIRGASEPQLGEAEKPGRAKAMASASDSDVAAAAAEDDESLASAARAPTVLGDCAVAPQVDSGGASEAAGGAEADLSASGSTDGERAGREGVQEGVEQEVSVQEDVCVLIEDDAPEKGSSEAEDGVEGDGAGAAVSVRQRSEEEDGSGLGLEGHDKGRRQEDQARTGEGGTGDENQSCRGEQRRGEDRQRGDLQQLEEEEEEEEEGEAKKGGGEVPGRVSDKDYVVAADGGELLPVFLISPSEETGRSGPRTAAEQSWTDDGRGWGEKAEAHEAGEEDNEEEEIVAPTAEELNEKFLEVVRLWVPILRNSGLPSVVGDDSNADPGDTRKTSPGSGLLPETEAFKAKAKVLAELFRREGASSQRPTRSTGGSRAEQSRSAAPVGSTVVHHLRAGGGTAAGGGARGAGRRTGGATATRKVVVGGAGVGAGGPISTTTTAEEERGNSRPAGTQAARKVQPHRVAGGLGSSGARASEGGVGPKAGRLSKARGITQRLSMSPRRTKLSAAPAVSAASRPGTIGRSVTASASKTLAKIPTAAAAGTPSSRRRNPLIRGSSSPRPPRSSVLKLAAAAGEGAGVAGGQGGAKRQVPLVAVRKRGGSVAGLTATSGASGRRLKGAASGETAGMAMPARTGRVRSRKASAAADTAPVKKQTVASAPGTMSKVPVAKNFFEGFFSAAKARKGGFCVSSSSITPVKKVKKATSSGKDSGVRTPAEAGGGGATPGSGSRSALKVFGFDPAASTSPRDARGTPNASAKGEGECPSIVPVPPGGRRLEP